MFVMAITGASGSGKSTLAEALREALVSDEQESQVQIISEDFYYADHSQLTFEQRGQLNFDHPSAIDHPRLQQDLVELKQSGKVSIPQYCFKQHLREPQTRLIKQPKVLILEGLHLMFDPNIRNEIDFSVYLDAPLDLCFIRRLQRDQQQRGRASDDIIRQYLEQVRPMFLEFIARGKSKADVVLSGESPIDSLVEDILSQPHLSQITHRIKNK
ncbi:uridine kinase [Pleionea litopenaei]|uniref:Uridine kinase n=1 Tax=Pleionea litopenaei TaxID=3070815 RepID=A0AA51RRU6_9GAMM|nr:uridine kinase [Pleionea sp. HL-JVS1]WMS86402.1 uridine kinase [Pleionea sp. HL-JVS1]